MISQRSQGMLQFMLVNDQLEAFDLATQIQEEEEWIEYARDASVAMWKDNKLLVVNDGKLVMATVLKC